MNMNKPVSLLFVIWILFCGLCFAPGNSAFASSRSKSAVLVVYSNHSGTTYNNELDKIVNAELQKRLEGLYIELDGEPYRSFFDNKDLAVISSKDVAARVKDSGTDYFIYLELRPFEKDSLYNGIYHWKTMTATVLLWIIRMDNAETLYKDSFSLKGKDQTDSWFIGNKSVAKKALKSTMFKVGEIISAKLPL